MTTQYHPSTPLLHEGSRFKIYEGDHRRNRHITACCKPLSVHEEYSEGLIGMIDQDEDGIWSVKFEHSDVRFYGSDVDDVQTFALELAEAFYGANRNMVVDLDTVSPRVTSELYRRASTYHLLDTKDGFVKKRAPRKKPPAKRSSAKPKRERRTSDVVTEAVLKVTDDITNKIAAAELEGAVDITDKVLEGADA